MTHSLFLLPELLILVAEYFSDKESIPPSTVSRTWNKVFSTRIWKTYSFGLDNQLRYLEGFVRNADLVRELEYRRIRPEHFALPCTRLTRLNLHCLPSGAEPSPLWQGLTKLVAQNNQLQEVDIIGNHIRAPYNFWSALTSRPNLLRLDILCLDITRQQFVTLWTACKRARSLLFENVRVDDASGDLLDGLEKLESLRELSLANPSEEQMESLRLLPNLCSLTLADVNLSRIKGVPDLTSHLRQGRLQSLVELAVDRAYDTTLSACLGAMTRVTKIQVDDGDFGPCSFDALQRHYTSLETLVIPYDSSITGAMILTILESCPMLTHIEATILTVAEIIQSKPWACLGLKVFAVRIVIDDLYPDAEAIQAQSRGVFERLSKLTRLRTLNIQVSDEFKSRYQTFQGLDLKLESGLALLSTLKDLRKLDALNTFQFVTAVETNWMLRTWTRLEQINEFVLPRRPFDNEFVLPRRLFDKE